MNNATGKLDHNIKFNGKTIHSKEYDFNEVFTGELKVYISDEWERTANNYGVSQFAYEIF